MKIRIYIDTSVIGGCYDDEFNRWSNQLFEEFRNGLKIAVISDLTHQELEMAPKKVRMVLDRIPESCLEEVITTREAEVLADRYITEGAITEKFYEDALHIANSTLERVNVLASWNFKHIVNLDRIRKYNSTNMKYGYPVIEIRTPREILKMNDDEN